MISENEIIDACINSITTDLFETRREIKSLEKEVETYEKVIKKLKELKE